MAYLNGASIEDLDGVGIERVEGFAYETHKLATIDDAGVVAEADDVGDDEADEVGVGEDL